MNISAPIAKFMAQNYIIKNKTNKRKDKHLFVVIFMSFSGS